MIIRLYKQEVPLVTIETLTHTNRSQIYRVLRRNFIPKGRASPKRISEGKIALIRDLRKEGWTVKAVAKELKVSHNTVSRYSKALQIRRNVENHQAKRHAKLYVSLTDEELSLLDRARGHAPRQVFVRAKLFPLIKEQLSAHKE